MRFLRNPFRSRTSFALLGVIVALGLPAGVLACGLPLEARLPAEQALLTFSAGRQEIITSVQLESDKPGAAVVFPVPGVPDVSALPTNDLFTYLEDVTKPEIRTVEVEVDNADAVAGGAPGSVSVLGRDVIGGYDVARLAADDPNALSTWLAENGYTMPPGAEPILGAYVAEGWKFVAVKLAGDKGAAGALTPLRMAFDSQKIVYPMRLGALSDRPVRVLLYVLADHRVDIPNMNTEFAGPVATFSQTPTAELAPLFRAPYLTKLRNDALAPASLTSDFVAQQAATDEAFRMVETRRVFVERKSRITIGTVLGLALALLASSVAFGFALGLRRRIDKVAGPPPDEDDD